MATQDKQAKGKVFTEDEINELEVIVFRVDRPRNQRFFPNGYLKTRVKPGETTEIPRWHPLRDVQSEEQEPLTDSAGNRLYRENRVPKGCTFIEYLDRAPRRVKRDGPEEPKTPKKQRAADTPVGA